MKFLNKIKSVISNRWRIAVSNNVNKLKSKGYTFRQCTDDYMRLSLLFVGAIITILILTILLIIFIIK